MKLAEVRALMMGSQSHGLLLNFYSLKKIKLPKTLFRNTLLGAKPNLKAKIPGAVNYHVAVDESNQQIVFLHKIAKGSTDRSYGIQVAKTSRPAPLGH